jgi:hypothetical protein
VSYFYFVCYTSGNVWGNTEAQIDGPIDGWNDVLALTAHLKKISGRKELIIISFQLLRKEVAV